MISLNDPVSRLAQIDKDKRLGLNKLGVYSVEDLLHFVPNRYSTDTERALISNLEDKSNVTIIGRISGIKVKRSFKGHMPMTQMYIEDQSGKILLTFFNQAYIGKLYEDGMIVKATGIVSGKTLGGLTVKTINNPKLEIANDKEILDQTPLFNKESAEPPIPIYAETKGISSLYLNHLAKRAFEMGYFDIAIDPIPDYITLKLHLPKLRDSLLYAHFPKKEDHTILAKKRFAFQDIFYIQVMQSQEKARSKSALAYTLDKDKKLIKKFIDMMPFKPTKSQLNVIDEIIKDINRGSPIGRLLEGDVGSGKTFIAAILSFLLTHTKSPTNGQFLQVAFMAPTEILARQHFENFIKYFDGTGIDVCLLTGKGAYKFPSKLDPVGYTQISKPQLKKWIKEGRVNMVIGTHALIQKTVEFNNLSLVIIDEQHRFGVKQRRLLASKGSISNEHVPHLLSMTATPIPRTLALTLFGDLDLSVLDQVPSNRLPIISKISKRIDREEVYKHIEKELFDKHQAYVIVPRIASNEDSETESRNVTDEAKALKERFKDFRVGILHSKMSKDEKELSMQKFADHEVDLLVATTVVEVGVNVPNATIMIIEGADKFGLSQLHQLRGRVGRSNLQSYCYLFTDSDSEISIKRLKNLLSAKDGFELAELDMKERGAGALLRGKQWGISDSAMEALKNPKLVSLAKECAKDLIDQDQELINHPVLKETIEGYQDVHLE